MKKRILFLIAVICISFFSQKALAQGNYIDVVYLKNGSVIKGIIVEQIPNVSLKIQTADGSLFVYKISEVEKMTKEATGRVNSISQPTNNYSNNNNVNQNQSSNVNNQSQLPNYIEQPNGYEGILELGYSFGTSSISSSGQTQQLSSSTLAYLKLNSIHNYRFNPYFSAGVGAGLRLYTTGSTDFCVPIFANARLNILKTLNCPFSPYVAFGMGYTFDISQSFQGLGLFINPSFGALYQISKQNTLNFGLGIEIQNFTDGSYTYSMSPLCINFGVSF